MKTSKEKRIRLILASLLIATALFDLITFLAGNHVWAFEINPLFIWFKSHWIIILGKIGAVGLMSYILVKPVGKHDWLRYAYVLSTLYMVFFQILGGISNLQVAAINPDPSTAMAPTEATNLYFTLVLAWYLAPMVMATLAFKIYKWCGYEP